MTTTTSYGTWYNHTGHNPTPGADILDAINGGDEDWRERMQTSGALDRIETSWRQAIQSALPVGVTLAGNEFIGPYENRGFPGYPTDEDGGLDIKAIVEDIDLMAIVEAHDVDSLPTVTAAHLQALLGSSAESPVLYLKADEDETPELDVWAGALVDHHQVITTQADARDALGDDPDEEATASYLATLQETLDELLAHA